MPKGSMYGMYGIVTYIWLKFIGKSIGKYFPFVPWSIWDGKIPWSFWSDNQQPTGWLYLPQHLRKLTLSFKGGF